MKVRMGSHVCIGGSAYVVAALGYGSWCLIDILEGTRWVEPKAVEPDEMGEIPEDDFRRIFLVEDEQFGVITWLEAVALANTKQS